MAIAIVSCANPTPPDGQHLVVKLAGTPVGPLSFYGRRRPDGPDFGPLSYTGTHPTYTVDVRGENPTVYRRAPYFIQARDNSGSTAWAVEWLCNGTGLGVVAQTQDLLYSILMANKAAIERAVALVVEKWPDGSPVTIRRIVRGLPAESGGLVFPIISVRPISANIDWYAMEMGMQSNIQMGIYAFAIHQLNVSWERAMLAIAEGIVDVLNQREYLEPALPCGLELRDCRVRNYALDLEQEGNGGWLTSTRITWAGVLETAYERF